MPHSKPVRSMLEALRIAAGLTQLDLARATGTAQSEISKLESRGLDPDDPRLDGLAKALNRARAALLAPSIRPRLLHSFGRQVPLRSIRSHEASVMIVHAQVASLLSGVDGLPQADDKAYGLSDLSEVDPENLATLLRQNWGLFREPFIDGVALAETHGIICVRGDLQHLGVAALGSWPDGHRPLMIIDPETSPSAQRRAIAHEIGHRLLQREASGAAERAAQAFAEEFVLPASPIRAAMYVDPDGIPKQADYWGVPVIEFAKRLHDLRLLPRRRLERYVTDFADQPGSEAANSRPQTVRTAVKTRQSNGEALDRIAESAFVSPNRIS
ncbi:XRE family transcriptional regulator [Microbacterium sp. 1P06AB]|uniref:XRE family transcriptional regulator n=1 Tax=Microbacterium sp. 1P06AB TaxID=3132289 RepID=UPI0039A5D981